jgi:hypothetical protein
MTTLEATFQELYQCPTTTNGDELNCRINYISQPVLDTIPSEEEIKYAVNKLRKHQAPGPSQMKAEDLQKWAKSKDNPQWQQSIVLIQHLDRGGTTASLLLQFMPHS